MFTVLFQRSEDNCKILHENEIDLLLLKQAKDATNENELKSILTAFDSISIHISSPAVVQKYINLLKPNKENKLNKFQNIFIARLKRIFDRFKSQSKQDTKHSFPEIFLKQFGSNAVLPLFAYIGLKTVEDNNIEFYSSSVVSLTESVLCLNNQSEASFLRSDGFKIMAHLLRNVSSEFLTASLYSQLVSLETALKLEKSQYSILHYVLLDLTIWCQSKDMMEFIVNIRSLLEGKPTLFLRAMNLNDLLRLLRLGFYYNEEDKTVLKRDVMALEARKALLEIAYEMCLNRFGQYEFDSIINAIFNNQDNQQRFEIMKYLLHRIISENKELFQNVKVFPTFFKMHQVLESDDEVQFEFIKIVVSLFRNVTENNMNEYIETIIIDPKTSIMPVTLINKVTNYMSDSAPELFQMVCFFTFKTGDFGFLEELMPDQRYVNGDRWITLPTMCAAKHINEKLIQFLVECSAEEWPKIYETILALDSIFRIETDMLISILLSSICNCIIDKRIKITHKNILDLTDMMETYLFYRINSSNLIETELSNSIFKLECQTVKQKLKMTMEHTYQIGNQS